MVSAYGLSEIKTEGEYLIAECGVPITLCAAAAQKASLEGMEFAYGIPGSCGGAVVMNAGAYGGSMSDVIESTLCYDCESGKLIEISADEHKFGYRESIYHSNPKLVMLEAKMKLKFGDSDAIYAKMNEYMQRRTQKQPLEYPSAGSVFKRYPGYYTAELIDNAGLKGMRIGGAEVSEKHAGFIINKGGATAEDVKQLIKLIQDRIKRMYDIEIEREVIYIE